MTRNLIRPSVISRWQWEPGERQGGSDLPSRLCAVTVHKGPYSGLPDAYGAIVSWIHANGYAMDGMPYEIYRKDFRDSLPPRSGKPEIFFPVKSDKSVKEAGNYCRLMSRAILFMQIQ